MKKTSYRSRSDQDHGRSISDLQILLKRSSVLKHSISAALIIVVLTSACNMPGFQGSASATANVTQAYETIQARLTEAGTLTPPASPTVKASDTPASTSTPTAGPPTSTKMPVSTTSPTTATRLCDQAEAGSPIDVTIPDDTNMSPGQSFTKVWRLRNAGTCSWSKNYSIAVFSGEPMSAPNSVPMPKQIDPGQTVDISVDLIAPTSAGSYQGNWKLRNAAGTWFGIGPGGSSPFWVRIIVSGGTGTPGTATPVTNTPDAATQVNDPAVLVSGTNVMVANDKLNLDTNLTNNGGEDVTLIPNAQGRLLLSTLGSAGMVSFGNSAPSYAQCLSANPGPVSVAMRNVPQGQYICHRTDQGLYGWSRVLSYNDTTGTLNIQINTWSNP